MDNILAEKHFKEGLELDEHGEYDKAIESYLKAIDFDPEHAEAYFSLGVVYYKLERYDEAVDAYLKAIEINPEHEEAQNNLGNFYMHRTLHGPSNEKLPSDGYEDPEKQNNTVYCRYCGEEIFEDAVVCPHCGRQVAPFKNNKEVEELTASPWATSNMIGLIVGTIILPFIGLIAGIYGLIKPGKVKQGFVLLIIAVFVSVIYYWLFFSLVRDWFLSI
ncbi:MAG TPA: tetratricopeptide repeat protein [Thermotogota bacterium]|nr:tetratricopeptide repeat protein [Thermotogota bacterium]HRW35912.1 tetratricopeptide repeat protein [Thermotogota bacterium]